MYIQTIIYYRNHNGLYAFVVWLLNLKKLLESLSLRRHTNRCTYPSVTYTYPSVGYTYPSVLTHGTGLQWLYSRESKLISMPSTLNFSVWICDKDIYRTIPVFDRVLCCIVLKLCVPYSFTIVLYSFTIVSYSITSVRHRRIVRN